MSCDLFYFVCFTVNFSILSVLASPTDNANLKMSSSNISSTVEPYFTSITDDCYDEVNQVYYSNGKVRMENGVKPLATCTGDGGVSRLDWMSSARQFTWSVNPRFSTVYTFSGVITITSSNGVGIDAIPVSCSGALGGQCGGNGAFTGSKGTAYNATLTGIAYDATGLKYTAACSTSFMYY